MRRASGCYQGVREAEALQILSRFDFAKLLSPGGCPTFEFYILHEALLEPLGSVDAKQLAPRLALAHQLRSFHELLVKHFGVSCLVPCVQVPLQELPPSDLEEHMECGTSEVRRQLTAEDVVACRTEDVKSPMLDALLEHCISSGLDPTPLPFLLLGLSAACALDMRDELVGRVTPVGAGGVKRTPVIVPSSVGVLLRSKPWIMSSRHGPCCAPDLLFPDQSSHSCLKEDARHVQLPESPATAELVSHLLDNLGVQRFSVAHVLKQLRLYSAADKQLLTEAQLTSMYLFLHHHMGQDGEIGQAMASGERLIFVPFERRLTKMNNTEANLRKGYWVSIADCCIMEVRFGQRIGCGMLLSLSGSPIRELELHYNKSLRDPFLHFGCRLEVSIHQLFVSIAYAAGNCKGPQHDPERALMWILRVLKWWQDGHLAQEDFDDVRRHFAEHAVLLSQDDAWRLWAETADDSGLFLPSDVPCPPNRLVSTKMTSIWPLLRDIGMKRAPSHLFSCEETQGCSGNEASTASQSAGPVQAGAAAQPQGSAQDNFKASEPTTAGVKPTEASSVELSLRRCLAYFQVWFYRLYPTEYQLVDSKVRDGLAESGALLSPMSSAGLQVCDDPGLQGLLKVLETFVFPAAHAAGLESKELSRLGVGLARDVWDRLQQAQDPARAAEKVLRLRGAPGRDPATEQLAWWLEEAPIPLGPPPARRGRSQHRDRAGPATSLASRGKVAARRSLSQVVGPQSETATHLGQRQNRRPPQRLRAEAPAFDGSKILVADSRITGDVRRNAFAPMASHWSLPQVLPWLGRSMHRAGIDRASDDYGSSQAHWQPAGFAGTADSSDNGVALGHAGAVHMGTASFQNDTRAVSRVVSGGKFRGPWTEYRESGPPSRELGATRQIRLDSPDRRPNYAGETSQPEVARAAGSQSAGSHPWNGERRHNSDTDGRSKQHVRATHQAGFESKAPAHRRRKLLRRSSSAPPSMGRGRSRGDQARARHGNGSSEFRQAADSTGSRARSRPPSDSEEVAASLLRDWLSLAQMLEVDSAADGVVMMPVDKLGWSHDRIYDHFGDGKSVYETVVELLMEKIRPVDLPALEIVCLGSRIYSISNRRLLAFKTFQLVLRRLKSEDSEVLVPVMLKRPTGDFFRRVGIALSTDTLGRSVGVSGPSGMSFRKHPRPRSLSLRRYRALSCEVHIDHYEDQPWTVCQPAHPGRARQLGYKHQPEAWPDGATWNIHHCQIDEEVQHSPFAIRTDAVDTCLCLPALGHDSCCAKATAAVGGGAAEMISDVSVQKPEAWDDEEDGQWERPLIRKPARPAMEVFLAEIRSSLEEAAPWLLLGLLCTAVLQALVSSEELAHRYLAGQGRAVVFKGAVLGLLSPLCSCGALPIAIGLAGAGAEPRATVAFTVAAQSAGVDSLLFTIGVLGPTAAAARMMAAGLLAVVAGLSLPASKPEAGCASFQPEKQDSLAKRLSSGIRAAVTVDFDEVAPSLLFGFALTSILAVVLPAGGLARTALLGDVWGRAAVLALALPLQFCEHASVLLAAALQKAGASGGLSFAVLTTLPAVNAASGAVLLRIVGVTGAMRVMFAIWLTGFIGSYLADAVGAKVEQIGHAEEGLPEWYVSASQLVMGAVAVAALFRCALRWTGTEAQHESQCCSGSKACKAD
ncbi:unnamed protein product [Polarella glacialis]|uniref:Uncharacterized protein n=1 Tax=Polarella glacialis TaxID=89957 RepID=A0A813LT50_POLGL|nr:unnamed protein product [Polarella glacialis]